MQSVIMKKQMAEMLWLLHYNRVLLKQGIITIDQFRRMENMIRTQKSASRMTGAEVNVQSFPVEIG